MAKVIQVIETYERRGKGIDDKDPVRLVYQLWSLDGSLIFENDDFDETKK